jgi:hypothetical protein
METSLTPRLDKRGRVFIPAAAAGQAPWQARPLPMLAHAAVYAGGQATWVPAQNRFIELPLSPKPAGTADTSTSAASRPD